MIRFFKWIKRIVFPKGWIVFFSIPLAVVGLVYVFVFDHQSNWSSYICYVFSAMSFTWICARVICFFGQWKQLIDRVPIAKRYLKDASFNTSVSLYRSLALNVFYAIVKFSFGMYYRSIWFIMLAIYYFFLAIIRFILLRHSIKHEFGENVLSEWKRYRFCGIFLFVVNLVLMGMVILILLNNEGFIYPGYFIYIMAMYAFYSIFVAIRGVIRYRKYRSPVMSSARVLQFVTALVSMLALETAMLAQFGKKNSIQFYYIMTGCTGSGVCIMIFSIAMYMMRKANKEIKNFEWEEK